MRPVCRAVQPPPGFDCPLGARQLWSAASRRFAQSPVSALPLFRHRSFCALRPSGGANVPRIARAMFPELGEGTDVIHGEAAKRCPMVSGVASTLPNLAVKP